MILKKDIFKKSLDIKKHIFDSLFALYIIKDNSFFYSLIIFIYHYRGIDYFLSNLLNN